MGDRAPVYQRFAERAYAKLVELDTTRSLRQLNSRRDNRLEGLPGDRDGQRRIRINRQWRVCFRWYNGDAYDAEIRDGATPELALRPGRYFGVTPRFWTDMQNAYDLHAAKREHWATITAQITPRITLDDIPDWASGNKITDTAN